MEYQKLVEIYEKLDSTTKRLEKTHYIAELLKSTPSDEMEKIVLLLEGRVFPLWDERVIGVASRLVLKAITLASGLPADKVEKEWKKTGDLGIVAQELIKRKRQRTLFSKDLTVKKVFDNIQKLATLEGEGAVEKKVQLIAELLTSAKPVEAKYITRTILEELRIGVGAGSLRDAIMWAFFDNEIGFKYNKAENKLDIKNRDEYNKYASAVQEAFDFTNDFAVVAEIAKTKGLKGLKASDISVGRPIKVMLAIKAKNIEDGFERVGKPAQAEFKYDGFRIQGHKKNGKITLFTRRLENVTNRFPEVVDYVKHHVKGDSFIFDSEAVGFSPKTKKYLPFQSISQRIKRKYDIEKMSEQFPVELNIFDLIFYNGKNLIKTDFKERRALLEKVIKPVERKIMLARKIVSSEKKDIEKFYKESLAAGNEGIMMKTLDAPYKPGARVGYIVKIKPVMETLDLVIVGADWGEGKRANWLSSFTVACVDDEGNYLEIGKVGTGIKEKEEEGVSFKYLTELLKPLIISEKGKSVKIKPKIVVEIKYEEIQKSPSYSSGYALRFPRLVKLRDDRRPDEASDLKMVEDLYEGQKK